MYFNNSNTCDDITKNNVNLLYLSRRIAFKLDILESDLNNIGKDIYNKTVDILELRKKFIQLQDEIQNVRQKFNFNIERKDNNEK